MTRKLGASGFAASQFRIYRRRAESAKGFASPGQDFFAPPRNPPVVAPGNGRRWRRALAGLALSLALAAAAPPPAPLPPPGIGDLVPPAGPDRRVIAGHWQWNGMREVWHPARTVPSFGPRHRWVRGHWRGDGARRVWVPGRWR